MSLKPLKKSDSKKGWMKKRRDKVILIQPEYHLIVTEGTKTEPNYFNSVKDAINHQYHDKIKLDVFGEGDNTLSLFEKAKNRVKQSLNGYKHVWLVFDTDDFPKDHINRTAELCVQNSTADIEYHAIWSNQCIELWYLLHFSYFQSDIHRQDYFTKLTKHLKSIGAGEYTKGRDDMYDILKPYMETAIFNAKKLENINKRKSPASAAPGTKVYELIELLKPYLHES